MPKHVGDILYIHCNIRHSSAFVASIFLCAWCLLYFEFRNNCSIFTKLGIQFMSS